MESAKKFGSWLGIYLAGVCFFFTANAYAFFGVINRDNIKDTLDQQQTYQKVVPALLSTATYPTGAATAGQLPLKEPWVEQAAQTAFPAQDLQRYSNTIIDSTFDWLEGKTNGIQFTVDLTANKQLLGQEVGRYAQQRTQALQPCPPGSPPQPEFDSFRSSCIPSGVTVNPDAVYASMSQQIANDQGFLKNPVLTADTTSLEPNLQSLSPSVSKLSSPPTLYPKKSLLLIGLPFLTILAAVVGIWLNQNHVKALRRLGRSFISTTIGLLVFAIILGWGLTATVNTTAKDQITKDVVGPVITSLAQDARTIYLLFVGIAAIIGVACFVVATKRAKPTR